MDFPHILRAESFRLLSVAKEQVEESRRHFPFVAIMTHHPSSPNPSLQPRQLKSFSDAATPPILLKLRVKEVELTVTSLLFFSKEFQMSYSQNFDSSCVGLAVAELPDSRLGRLSVFLCAGALNIQIIWATMNTDREVKKCSIYT